MEEARMHEAPELHVLLYMQFIALSAAATDNTRSSTIVIAVRYLFYNSLCMLVGGRVDEWLYTAMFA